jgi:hypothetical protein
VELSLSHNRLAGLSPGLSVLTRLEVLALADNALVAVPPEFGLVSRITALELRGAPSGGPAPRAAEGLDALDYIAGFRWPGAAGCGQRRAGRWRARKGRERWRGAPGFDVRDCVAGR